MIGRKGILYPGQHPLTLDKGLFEDVERMLDANRRRHAEKHVARKTGSASAPLTGRIFEAEGQPMSRAASRGKPLLPQWGAQRQLCDQICLEILRSVTPVRRALFVTWKYRANSFSAL